MITTQDIINAWREIINAVDSDEGVKVLKDCVVRISDKFEGTNLKASYDPTNKRVSVSKNLDKEELLTALAHEACHILERAKGPEVLTERDLQQLLNIVSINNLDDQNVGHLAIYLIMTIKRLARDWTDKDRTDKNIDYIDLCLDRLEEEKKSGETKIASFWNWFARNMDKIDESIDYYQVGGHNDGWLDWRDKLEDALSIKIDLAD
jgi:hypothetical protein